jgi:hypothetical protein
MRSPSAIAFFHPINMAMLFLSVLAGLFAAWWLAPFGGLLWLIMVVRLAQDPSVRLNFDMQERAGTLSMRFQSVYNNVVRSQTRIFNTLLSARGGTKRALSPVQDAVADLTNRVYNLCQQMTAPENYVKVSKNTDLEGQRALITLSLDSITDAKVRQEKQEMLKALDDRIHKIKDTATMIDRAEAQLSGIAMMLDTMLADVIRLQALGGAQAEQEAPKLLQQLHAQMDQLDHFGKEIAQSG